MPTTYVPIANSTYLDYSGYGITSAPTVESAYGITDGVVSPYGLNVALVLPRVTDASGFLAQDWGTRQQTLETLNSQGTLWSTYGASQTLYNDLVNQLQSAPFNLDVLQGSTSEGNYVSSAASRTIWVNVATAADFQALFNTELMYSQAADLIYWNGGLSLLTGWNVTGLWVDYGAQPDATNLSTATPITLTLGSQSVGNASTSAQLNQDPQDIATLYDFPPDGRTVQTGTIGLIEPGIGSALSEREVKEGPSGEAAPARSMSRVRTVNSTTATLRANARSMSGWRQRSIPTARSPSTTARATSATRWLRSSRQPKARSGIP